MVDVGGTTTDIGVVTEGAVRVDRRGFVDVAPTSFELAEITSHGVGGSSVIRLVDGEIEVGPESVGAAPGPACFGLGGVDATITDVYLLMGILDPSTYLGGTLKLDAGRSAKIVTDNLAAPLGVSLDEALARMEDAYLERVAEAIRSEATVAPDTVIAAFGGAGPMTVCGAATRAGIRQVIVPRTAAVFSAFGIGFSDVSQHYEHPLPATDAATVAEIAGRLRERARRDMFAEGVELDDCEASFRVVLDRNGDSVSVPLGDSQPTAELVPAGEVASLELSLVAPLPHVAMGANAKVSERSATSSGHAHDPRPRRYDQRSARLRTRRSAGRRGPRRAGNRRGSFLHDAASRPLAVANDRGRRRDAERPEERVMRVPMTEYLEIDLDSERWLCRRCGHDLAPARRSYKEGTLVHDRDPREIHRPLLDPARYEFTFAPDPAWCRILEFCCPSCGTMIEVEYLPPGHPPTFDMEIDVDALKAYWAGRSTDAVPTGAPDVPVNLGHAHQH